MSREASAMNARVMPHPGQGIDVSSLKGHPIRSREIISDGFMPSMLIATNKPNHTRSSREAGDGWIPFHITLLVRCLGTIFVSYGMVDMPQALSISAFSSFCIIASDTIHKPSREITREAVGRLLSQGI